LAYAQLKVGDAALKIWPDVTDRISYVITLDKKIYAMYEGVSPEQHVKRTLDAVQAYSKAQAPK